MHFFNISDIQNTLMSSGISFVPHYLIKTCWRHQWPLQFCIIIIIISASHFWKQISIPDLTKLLNTVLHIIYIQRRAGDVQRDILISSAGTRKPLSASFLSTNLVAGGCVWVLHTLHHKLRGLTSFLFQIKIKSMLLQHIPLDKIKLEQDFVLKWATFKI